MKNEELRVKNEEFAAAMNNEAIKTMGFLKALMCSVALVLCSSFFISCSEEDNFVEEYPDWQKTNELFFKNLSDSVQNLIDMAPQRTDWKRIKSWSKPGDAGEYGDYIIVNVLEEGSASDNKTPLYTDSVSIDYLGRLLPSTSHPYGYVFDQSYYGEYDPDISTPMKFAVGSVVDGFSTALQHMHKGDKWRVYIPYELGYGTSDASAIPGYSTLIFDITMVDFWSRTVK